MTKQLKSDETEEKSVVAAAGIVRRLRPAAAWISTTLSFAVVVLLVLAGTFSQFLEMRARWSGDIAPAAWRLQAAPDDIFEIEGLEIAYWGDPAAGYSKYATRGRRPPEAIIVHHTAAKPVKNLVNYGHVSDANRGGASFGYHFYIGRDGNVVQGAPLSRRTNHIKFKTHKQRRDTAKHLWSGNTIAVSLVGGCDPMMRPRWANWSECSEEFITPQQLDAGLIVIRALQSKFALKCEEVYGHGDLQFDRESFEGERLSRMAREGCGTAADVAIVPPAPIALPKAGSKPVQATPTVVNTNAVAATGGDGDPNGG